MHLPLKKKAVIGLCIVALSFVLLNIGVRFMNEGFQPFTQVYLRTGGAALLALLLFHKKIQFSKFKKIAKKDWLLITLMGTVGYGIAVSFITLGALNTTLLNVSLIGSTIPFFALLYLMIITRKSLKLSLFLFLIISFLGVYLITTKSISPINTDVGIGELYAFLFAAGTGVFIVSRKYISKSISNVEITVLMSGIAFLSSLIIAIAAGEKLEMKGFTEPLALLGLAMGIVLNVVATQLQNFSFEHINPVAGSQLLLLQNIFAPILGFILYSETVLPIEFLGAALILIGVFGYYKKAAN